MCIMFQKQIYMGCSNLGQKHAIPQGKGDYLPPDPIVGQGSDKEKVLE